MNSMHCTSTLICSEHFEKKFYFTNRKKITLHKNAEPTIFPVEEKINTEFKS